MLQQTVTNHASGRGHSFEVGELSQLQQCCSKLCTREGEEDGTTTQGNVASGQQNVVGPASNSASLMLNPRGPSPFQDINSEHGMDSNDQIELSCYKRLYNQAREDLDELKGQAKRRSIQMVPPAICAYQNKFLEK